MMFNHLLATIAMIIGVYSGPIVPQSTHLPSVCVSELSIGDDAYGRVLQVVVVDLKENYKSGESIPLTIGIINVENDRADLLGHPSAQLFPHLDLKVGGRAERIKLPFASQFQIYPGEMFTYKIDLSKTELIKGSGIYRIKIGHQNYVTTDNGDWTGSAFLQSTITID